MLIGRLETLLRLTRRFAILLGFLLLFVAFTPQLPRAPRPNRLNCDRKPGRIILKAL